VTLHVLVPLQPRSSTRSTFAGDAVSVPACGRGLTTSLQVPAAVDAGWREVIVRCRTVRPDYQRVRVEREGAVTDVAAVIVTLHVLLPLQPPPRQP